MKKYLLLNILVIFILSAPTVSAQQNELTPGEGISVKVSHAQFLGEIPPLRDLVGLKSTSQERRQNAKDRKREVPNFMHRRMPTGELDPNALPKGVDPVRQDELVRNAGVPVEPLVNIDGMNQSQSGSNPPDVCGDMGIDYYIQMVNASLFQVFDKDGNEIAAPIATNTIWSQVGQQSAGDPIILFDQEVNRWIITEFPFGNFMLFAISDSSDPFGAWKAYAFSTPSFPDYPKYSIWSNAYCITTNEDGSGTLVNYFINRDEILAGAVNPTIQRVTLPGVVDGPGFFVSTPVDWTGLTPPPTEAKPMILRLDDDAWGSVGTDGITIFEMDVDFSNASNTSVVEKFVPTAAFNTAACAAPGAGFACIPQLGGGGIDGLPEVIMHQVHYRNFVSHESMVLNFLVNADGTPIRAGIRWMELRRIDGGDWTVYQEGTFAPTDDLHRFMGGIAMDGSGNIGLAYSFSSPNHHPGIAFTGRKASDPLGVMTIDEYFITDGFSTQPGFRYGDYAQMTVDPVDDRTFWYTGEYRRPSNWGTKIFAFQVGRDTNDIGPIELNNPQSSADLTDAENVEITVKNFGLETQTEFEVGYIFENGTAVVEQVNFSLESEATYTHVFSNTVDMSLVGEYEFNLFTNLNGDDSPLNDSLRVKRSKLPRFDAGISGIEGLDQLLCGPEAPITIILNNYGSETLTSVDIIIRVNGAIIETIAWTGSLLFQESESVSFDLSGYLSGSNDIEISTANPNGNIDEDMLNDAASRDFMAQLDGEGASLLLLTDDYPNETTWQLSDDQGTVIFTGGPYSAEMTLFTEDWCLEPEGCYVFTIFDSANDGICCDFGQGNYSIIDAAGNTLVSSPGIFGASETLEFCLGAGCQMTADIDMTPTSSIGASDGALLIVPVNGVGPYTYSIDGGMNFQPENIFDNLPAGDYDIVIMGQGDCLYEETVTLLACSLSFTVETTSESNSNSNDGSIEIMAENGNGTLNYSIDGGLNFQVSPTFTDLGMGEYEVVVEDELGCSVSTVVTVGIINSERSIFHSQKVEVYPNPTMGVVRLKVTGLNRANPLLPILIYDKTGKMIQSSNIARYDEEYTGQVSLVAYPSGVYFIRLLDENMDRLVRVVKR